MTDVLADDSASAEPVDVPAFDNDDLTQDLGEPDGDDEGEADDQEGDEEGDETEDDGLIDWQDDDGKTYRVPPKVRDGLMLKADHTRKTMALAEQQKSVAARDETLQKTAQRQQEFAGDIAQLGAMGAALEPYNAVQDWPTYLRQGGADALAHYHEYQALLTKRDQFAHQLGQKVQQRAAEEQRETVEQIAAGRVEIAKHIKGYGPETLDKLAAFAEPFGFSPDEIRQAEADPRSIRILHLAQLGQQALTAQKRTSTIAQGQKTKPVQTLRGAGGRIVARPDTDDFTAFERAQDEKVRAAKR